MKRPEHYRECPFCKRLTYKLPKSHRACDKCDWERTMRARARPEQRAAWEDRVRDYFEVTGR